MVPTTQVLPDKSTTPVGRNTLPGSWREELRELTEKCLHFH